MKPRLLVAFAFAGVMGAQPTPPALSAAAFAELAARCVPGAPLATLRSVVNVESAFHPFAVSINYPEVAGTQLGIGEGNVTLARQPGNLAEAVRWSRWLLANGQTVSVGLMQLNIEHLAAFKISLERAFDPCTNLKVGWTIFGDKYAQASAILGKGQLAMHAALSAYNSGSLVGGFRNGYVEAILRNQHREEEAIEPPPAEDFDEPRTRQLAGETSRPRSDSPLQAGATEQAPQKQLPNPRTTETKVVWDLTRASGTWVPKKQE